MSEEEDDYMSDKLLASLTDVRPSLVKSTSSKRLLKVEEKHKEYIKRQKQESLQKSGANRNELLQKSLERPIEQGNKGFQLLAKMGYKPGDALGKVNSEHGSTGGLKEPIGISIKSDRGGLGRESALLELAEKRKELRRRYLQRMRQEGETTTVEEYRRRMTSKAEENLLQAALRQCQKTCEDLDIRKGEIAPPNISWFWPDRIANQSEDAADVSQLSDDDSDQKEEIEYTVAEKVEMLTSYLRTAYAYCHWCGVHYEDKEDMTTNCPGSERNDH